MWFVLLKVSNTRFKRSLIVRLASVTMLAIAGCRTTGAGGTSPGPRTARSDRNRVRGVVCVFDLKPWISADAAGDRDPEGIRYRVFLDDGSARGVLHEGKFHIEMYRIGKNEKGELERTLVSDWHYPVDEFQRVSAKVLGMGYHLQLRWAKKSISGSEVEIITQFEDADGFITRGATKRLRVPKYTS